MPFAEGPKYFEGPRSDVKPPQPVQPKAVDALQASAHDVKEKLLSTVIDLAPYRVITYFTYDALGLQGQLSVYLWQLLVFGS
jgi:hypothetical protein